MENDNNWHYRIPTSEEVILAKRELKLNENTFAEEITKLAVKNKKIVLLSGDIGNRLFDNFRKIHRNRFYNCGIAEVSMTGIASGFASMGFLPVTTQ